MGVGVLRASVVGLVVAVVLATAPAAAQTAAQDGAPECGVATGGGSSEGDDGVLRIATYNILHSQGSYDDETMDRRIELVADAIAETGADIVGMQEVVASANHGLVAQRVAAALGERTGDDWAWCFFRSNPHLPGEPDAGPGGVGGPVSQAIAEVARSGDSPWSEGVAIVARFQIEGAAAHRLLPRAAEAPVCQVENPDDPLSIPTCAVDTRQVLWAAVGSPCGTVDVFSTHLANNESSASESTRRLQIIDALAEIGRRASEGPAPDVFVGDFNTLEGGPVWQAVIDAGFVDGFRSAAPDDPGFTSGQDIAAPEPTVGRRIDFVFVRPGDQPLDLDDGEVIGDTPAPFAGSGGETVVWPSDHYGVAVSVSSGTMCASAGEAATEAAPSVAAAADPSPATVTAGRLPATGGGGPAWPLGVVGVLGVVLAVARSQLSRRWGSASG